MTCRECATLTLSEGPAGVCDFCGRRVSEGMDVSALPVDVGVLEAALACAAPRKRLRCVALVEVCAESLLCACACACVCACACAWCWMRVHIYVDV